MTGMCCASTCEEGGTLLCSGLERERGEMDKEKEKDWRRETFTEPEPERQTGKEYNLFFPCSVFAACPHSQVNKQRT